MSCVSSASSVERWQYRTVPIRHINIVAEYLYDYQRETIESVFGTELFNWYDARELGHIATERRGTTERELMLTGCSSK